MADERKTRYYAISKTKRSEKTKQSNLKIKKLNNVLKILVFAENMKTTPSIIEHINLFIR